MHVETNDYYWWKLDDDAAHSSVFNYLNFLSNTQGHHSNDNIKHMRLYGNYDYEGFLPYTFAQPDSSYAVQNRVTMNIVQSMVDTIVSKITKQKPRPYFLTEGGSFELKRKAEKLTQFADGLFYSTDYYKKAQIAFKDATIFGTGFLKIYNNGSKIIIERVLPDEIILDDAEAVYGEPRQMHQRKWIHKDVLKAMFPKKTLEIDLATSNSYVLKNYTVRNKDMVLCVESWHLPSSKKAKDGKHMISIQNCTLMTEDYEKDYFPFVVFRWRDRQLGFFGQGIPEQLCGLQLEINKILRTIQVSMHLVSVPKLLVEASSKIIDAHLNNKIGGIIKYIGSKPDTFNMGQIPPELFNHLERLYAKAYEVLGISQLSANALKPSGLESGKALRVYNEIESERFVDVSQLYEQASLDAIEIMIDLTKDIAESDENFSVKSASNKFLKTIKWSEIDLEDDKYTLQLFPVSFFSNTPSARLAEVQELMGAGLISPEEGRKLMDFPDLKGFYKRSNSSIDDIEAQVERMVDSGQYEAPEPYQNLTYGIQFMQQVYLMYRAEKAPESTLELLRQWMDDANEMLQRSQAQTMAAQSQALETAQAATLTQSAPQAVEAPTAQF